MTVNDIIDELAHVAEYNLPRKALREAVAQKEAITPVLLQILDDCIQGYDDNAELEESEWLMPNMAAYLLASFGEKAAHSRLVRLFSLSGEELEFLWEDGLTEDGGRLLLSTYPGDPEMLQKLIEDEAADEFARSKALEALYGAVSLSLLKEETLAAYLTSLFRGRIQREPSFLWDSMVNVAADLKLVYLETDIRKAFEEGLCDELILGFEQVQQLVRGELPWPGYEAEVPTLITDAELEMADWPYFQQPLPPAPPIKVKVGRNDPCPCGSGKKYKKCCGVGT
ncbi:MAG: hypothetical protein JWO94_3870 [Verrucomicrobiaceae bacterium]|nr:hypothetical protein [Verrucomicrobiaceae bacterium]